MFFMNCFAHSRRAQQRLYVVTFLITFSGFCQAEVIYRWVDERGRTHMSDVVPEAYKETATRIDPKQFELTKAERAEALARAERDRLARAEAEGKPTRTRQSKPSSAKRSGAESSPANESDAQDSGSDCDRQWQAYHAAQECFSPHRGTKGVKAEAFEHCKSVENPSQRCGPAKM